MVLENLFVVYFPINRFNQPNVRSTIHRFGKISNTPLREIKGYGKNCRITNPDGLRNYFRQELIEMGQLYNIEIYKSS